jgi:hypothetical protein
VRIVGGFCDVAVYLVELCDFAGWGLGGGGCFCDLRISIELSDREWIWLTSCFMYLSFFILPGGQLGCDGINALMLTPRLGPWSTIESPWTTLCSAKSLSGALVASSSSAMFA